MSFSELKVLLKRYYLAAYNCGEIEALERADALDEFDIDISLEEAELEAGSIGNEILNALKENYTYISELEGELRDAEEREHFHRRTISYLTDEVKRLEEYES
jgi:hypothetical protein